MYAKPTDFGVLGFQFPAEKRPEQAPCRATWSNRSGAEMTEPYAGPDRRDQDVRGDLYTKVELMQANLDANTAMTQQLTQQVAEIHTVQEASRADSAELLDIFRAIRGTLKVMAWGGNVLKWVSAIAASVIAAYLAMKGGGGGNL